MTSPAHKWAALDFGIGELFTLIGDGVVIGDASTGTIVLWNPAAEQIFGYLADEAVGMSLERLVPPELLDAHRDGLARYAATGHGPLVDGGTTVELPAVHRDGTTVHVELRLSALRRVPQEGAFVLGIVRDMSVRHRMQQQLADTADRLETANATLRDFVSMAAHDLKTPLTVVMGALDALVRDSEIAEAQRTFVDMAVRQSQHLDRLVDALLLLARLDAGALEPLRQTVTVADAVAESLRTLPDAAAVVDARGLADLEVFADPDHVHRVLVNYLSNALRYGQPPIVVEAHASGPDVVLSVEDDGPGVPDDLVDTLFERFSRGATVHAPGTGLGLSIVRGLARANGGDAWYERGAHGARFWVRLAAAPNRA